MNQMHLLDEHDAPRGTFAASIGQPLATCDTATAAPLPFGIEVRIAGRSLFIVIEPSEPIWQLVQLIKEHPDGHAVHRNRIQAFANGRKMNVNRSFRDYQVQAGERVIFDAAPRLPPWGQDSECAPGLCAIGSDLPRPCSGQEAAPGCEPSRQGSGSMGANAYRCSQCCCPCRPDALRH